jgi:hypothetical protein
MRWQVHDAASLVIGLANGAAAANVDCGGQFLLDIRKSLVGETQEDETKDGD